jgi:HEAT repeat protein
MRSIVLRITPTVFAVSMMVLCAAANGHAQGRITNAKAETRTASQGLESEMRAIAARPGVTWVGYRIPMIAGSRHMCCYDTFQDSVACCGVCRLETGSGVTLSTGDDPPRGSRIPLEAPSEFFVLARHEGGAITRIRTFTPDCDVDAGGMVLVWLNEVNPDESVAWLTSLIESSAARVTEYRSRVAKQAMAALSLHRTRDSLTALLTMARSHPEVRVRSDALFWLSQRAGQEAVAAITDAVTNDPETEVKKRAVFALSQLPKDEGVPKLIEVARTNRNPEVRKQAFFWLGQSKDPRAIQLFEQILLKN